MKRKFFHISITILVLFFVSSCSSSKNAQGNFIGRAWQDMVARDNGYFNARELMKTDEVKLADGQDDNYEAVLPVFKTGTADQQKGFSADMDDIIQKTSLVIQLHPKSKWTDDCYFLIGKADYYKGNYADALKSFQYVISEYSDLIKRNPKGRVKPETSGKKTFFQKFQQEPAYNEASIWVARTLTAMQKYADAQTVLSVIESRDDFPDELKGELYAEEADNYILQEQEAKAEVPLQTAIDNTDEKKVKARYSFILSQIYAGSNDDAKSIDELKNVIAFKPDYKMEFYARLDMAKMMSANYGISGGSKNNLQALLKDEKYKEFYSLIYYTLANISLDNKDNDQGMDYLNKAIRNAGTDTKYKSLSYLRLGDIYFADQDYPNAYAYYDSTLNILPKENERYDEITRLHAGLKQLVEQLTIIKTEKQLQQWATLSPEELDKILNDKLKSEEQDTAQNTFINTPTAAATNTATGDFYFYNTTLLSRGFSEYKNVWGDRKLEDNWRRSEKTTSDNSETEEGGTSDSISSAGGVSIDLSSTKITKDQIISSIPKSPAQIKASNERIAAALYKSGTIYKENFNNNAKAQAAFEENVNDYPGNNSELLSLYQLYILTNPPKQDDYKNAILTKYPQSLFANVISDPDYMNKQNKKNEDLETFYTTTYNYFLNSSLDTVVMRTKAADTLFKPNPLKPKFDMLNALVLGKQDSVDQFKKALQVIAIKYPKDDVGIRAQEILDYMRRGTTMDDASKTAVNYVLKPDEEHYFLFILNAENKDANTLKNNIATFNTTNFSLSNLKISSLLLGKDNSIIIVKSFPKKADAMTYYNSITNNTDVFQNADKNGVTPVVISKSNYVLFFKSKDIVTYETFFQNNYLQDN